MSQDSSIWVLDDTQTSVPNLLSHFTNLEQTFHSQEQLCCKSQYLWLNRNFPVFCHNIRYISCNFYVSVGRRVTVPRLSGGRSGEVSRAVVAAGGHASLVRLLRADNAVMANEAILALCHTAPLTDAQQLVR